MLLGPHFLCQISRVVPFKTWLISSWEEINCCYKQMYKMTSIAIKIVSSLLVTTVIFFSAWGKSRDILDNSQNSTQKKRTLDTTYRISAKYRCGNYSRAETICRYTVFWSAIFMLAVFYDVQRIDFRLHLGWAGQLL